MTSSQQQSRPAWFLRPSLFSLLLVNMLVMVFAIVQSWSLATIVWTYWCQGVIIGLFQAKKMYDLKQFSTEGFTINNRPTLPTEKTKHFTVGFFLFHYNFFHLGYFAFLSQTLSNDADWVAIMWAACAFFVNHLFSYMQNRAADETRILNIGHLMFQPYVRVIPMHFFIMFFVSFTGVIPLMAFFLLKTIADVIGHLVLHRSTP